MKIDPSVTPQSLDSSLSRVFSLAAEKARDLDRSWDVSRGTPVFTVEGRYTSRGWTEWTQGFQYGCAILAGEATGDAGLIHIARRRTVELMATHVTHVGVHDHGFNNLSTYGNLRRLLREGTLPANEWELAFYDLSIKASGAVQAARWSDAADGLGYVYSFNGPHSLFVDTMRTLRILGVAHQLGHVLMGENDRKISLLGRVITHGLTTAKYVVYYGEGRDSYDTPTTRGRTTHEAIFNRNDGRFRCPSSQQGYSPFSTWTRGLAWAMVGFAEELEFLSRFSEKDFQNAGAPGKTDVLAVFLKAARATCDFYLNNAACTDGVCYWDTGAPNLHRLGDYLTRPADPFNENEPVDASASAIAAQGLIRLGTYLGDEGATYTQAGLNVTRSLFGEPYLSTDAGHQGLLLHSVYHRPNGWDHIPAGREVPCGESSMWGDYHLLELALLIRRMGEEKYLTFFDE